VIAAGSARLREATRLHTQASRLVFKLNRTFARMGELLRTRRRLKSVPDDRLHTAVRLRRQLRIKRKTRRRKDGTNSLSPLYGYFGSYACAGLGTTCRE
jgi:hypothetical protein